MFVEYIRILNMDSGFPDSAFAVMGKISVIMAIGLALIYLGYKLLGEFGAIAVFMFEAALFLMANNLMHFTIIY